MAVDITSDAAGAFTLAGRERVKLWWVLSEAMEDYLADVGRLGAVREATQEEVRQALAAFDFDRPLEPVKALEVAVDALRQLQPHVRHPRHFGLFDAAPTTMGVMGAALAAVFNTCLASWAGSPFGVGAERLLVSQFAARFGYDPETSDGIVTSGGSEANFSALQLALAARFPDRRERGLRGLAEDPVVYVGSEAHPSALKAAVLAGLGADEIRDVPVDPALRIDLDALGRMIDADLGAGRAPVMIVATAGTTSGGAIDPIEGVADLASRHGLWLHVDAAWGGAGALVPGIRHHFAGLDRADSITFDTHKWMAVPLAAGMLLTRHPELLTRAFSVDTGFLAEHETASVDPMHRSLRWSRSFCALKILLSLAVAGWEGYEQMFSRHISLGDYLRSRLQDEGWRIVNHTPLPLVCFVDGQHPAGDTAEYLDRVTSHVNETREARIYRVLVGGAPVLRVSITNHETSESDIDQLVTLLDEARSSVRQSAVA